MNFILKPSYNKENVTLLASQVVSSVIIANILTPLFLFYLTYKYLDIYILYSWLFTHLGLATVRYFSSKKLLKRYKPTHKELDKFVYLYQFLVFLTALSYAFILWYSVLENIPTINIIITSSVIIALSAGAVSTLVSVFHIFATFVITGMLLQILAILYINNEVLNIYSIVLSMYLIFLLKAGYKQNQTITNLSFLKDSFQSLYEKSPDGIAIIKDNRFKDCNQAILDMFELNSQNAFLQVNISNFMPKYQEDGSDSIRKMIRMSNAAKKFGQHSFEWKFIKSDGSLFWVDLVLTKITIQGDELLYGRYRDITRRKLLEGREEEFRTKLKQRVDEEVKKNRLKDQYILQQSKLAQMGEMISMIAHQWRQPLSAISATSGSISIKAKIGTLDNETSKQLADNITEYSQHLSRTIDDFRNFFKENKTKENTTLDEIVQETLDIVRLSLENLEIKLITAFDSKSEIYTYKNELKQVVLNIIKNAEDIFKEKNIKNPKITIITKDKTITIKDNAGGIPKDIIDKIFEPYFSTKIQKDGTGLGLYMSKTIIDEHCNGELKVHNDKNGAVFTIMLENR